MLNLYMYAIIVSPNPGGIIVSISHNLSHTSIRKKKVVWKITINYTGLHAKEYWTM